MSESLFENFSNRGFQLSKALSVACATLLATNSQVKVGDNLNLKRTEISYHERSYNISWQDGQEEFSLVVKPIQKDDGLHCIVIRATQEDLKTGDFKTIHNINSQIPHENGRQLKAKFAKPLEILLENFANRGVSERSGRGA